MPSGGSLGLGPDQGNSSRARSDGEPVGHDAVHCSHANSNRTGSGWSKRVRSRFGRISCFVSSGRTLARSLEAHPGPDSGGNAFSATVLESAEKRTTPGRLTTGTQGDRGMSNPGFLGLYLTKQSKHHQEGHDAKPQEHRQAETTQGLNQKPDVIQ